MQTVFLAVLACLGGAAVLWLLLGLLLLPVGTPKTVQVTLLASGGAEDIEQILRGLYWLCASGLLDAEISVVDAGLNEAGLERVRLLCSGHQPENRPVPYIRQEDRGTQRGEGHRHGTGQQSCAGADRGRRYGGGLPQR